MNFEQSQKNEWTNLDYISVQTQKYSGFWKKKPFKEYINVRGGKEKAKLVKI